MIPKTRHAPHTKPRARKVPLFRISGFGFRIFSAALAVTAGALTACKVGPNYQRPDLDTPATYKSTLSTRPVKLGHDWWTLFNDPQLTALEEAATKYNPDLQAAMARVIQAREAAKAVKSQFYPSISLNPSYTRTATGTGTVFPEVYDSGRGHVTNAYSIPFDLSYEIDVWGRVKRSVESANAQAQATADAYWVVLQGLQADVAQNYFNLRSLDTQHQILAENVALYREQLRLTNIKVHAQISPKSDAAQLLAILDTTLSAQIDVDRQRNDVEHALAILTGRPPSELSLPENPLSEDPPPVVPAGLPSDILRRRPDVAQAEQNLIAANASVGVATAEFYPKFTLTASTGLASLDLKTLFLPESRFSTFGPAVSIPIFQGGQLTANLEQARARYLELYASYRSTLLGAFRDVEDSLNDLQYYRDQVQAQKRAVDDSREFLRLSQIQFKEGGIISQLQLIDADRTLLLNQIALNNVVTARNISTVLLIKALGGGWEQDPATTQPHAPLTTLPAHSPSDHPATQPGPIEIYPRPPATAPMTLPAPPTTLP